MWNKIKAIEGRWYMNKVALKDKEQIINDPLHIENLFTQQFSTNSSDNNYDEEFNKHKTEIEEKLGSYLNQQEHENDNPINLLITLSEILETIEESNNDSPGPDQIPNILLKKLPQEAIRILLEIYNIIWSDQVFPDQWKQAI